MRMLVISLWPSLARPCGTAQTPVQPLALLKAEFAKLNGKVVTAPGLALSLGSNVWYSEGFQIFLQLCHVPSESDSCIYVIIPTKSSVSSSQSLIGLVSSSSSVKGQSSHLH